MSGLLGWWRDVPLMWWLGGLVAPAAGPQAASRRAVHNTQRELVSSGCQTSTRHATPLQVVSPEVQARLMHMVLEGVQELCASKTPAPLLLPVSCSCLLPPLCLLAWRAPVDVMHQSRLHTPCCCVQSRCCATVRCSHLCRSVPPHRHSPLLQDLLKELGSNAVARRCLLPALMRVFARPHLWGQASNFFALMVEGCGARYC